MCIRLIIILLCLPFETYYSQQTTLDDLILMGQCESFDAAPQACSGIMKGSWANVWTVPSAGLTQEYWHARMNDLNPTYQMSLIDLVTILPQSCALQYLKMI